MYQLMYNKAAGEHYVQTWATEDVENWERSGYDTQDGYFTEVGLFDTEEELDKAVEALRGDTVFVVFYNNAAGEGFVSEEDGLSGNWRGSKYGYFSKRGEYSTRDEAKAALHRLLS